MLWGFLRLARYAGFSGYSANHDRLARHGLQKVACLRNLLGILTEPPQPFARKDQKPISPFYPDAIDTAVMRVIEGIGKAYYAEQPQQFHAVFGRHSHKRGVALQAHSAAVIADQ